MTSPKLDPVQPHTLPSQVVKEDDPAQLAPSENRSTKECGRKDGDRGGSAHKQKLL